MNDICVQKKYRKIRDDHTFSYGNKFYIIESTLKHSIARQSIEIRKQSNDQFNAYFAGRQLLVSEVVEPTNPTIYDLEIQKKIDAIELAEKLGNVAEAVRICGCSRETIYKNRRLLQAKGPVALKRTFRHGRHLKNGTAKTTKEIVIAFSLENPHLGQAQVSAPLKTTITLKSVLSGLETYG